MSLRSVLTELGEAADDAALVAASWLGRRPGLWLLPLLLAGPAVAVIRLDLGVCLGVAGGTLAGGLVAGEVARGRGKRLRMVAVLLGLAAPVLLVLGVDPVGWVSWEGKLVYLAGAFTAVAAVISTMRLRSGLLGLRLTVVVAAAGLAVYGSAGWNWHVPVHLRTLALGAMLLSLAALAARRAWLLPGLLAAAALTWADDLGPRAGWPPGFGGLLVLGAAASGRVAGARVEWDADAEVRDRASAHLAAWCQRAAWPVFAVLTAVAAYVYFTLFSIGAEGDRSPLAQMAMTSAGEPPAAYFAVDGRAAFALRAALPALVATLLFHLTAGRRRALERTTALLAAVALGATMMLCLYVFRRWPVGPGGPVVGHDLAIGVAVWGMVFGAVSGFVCAPDTLRARLSVVDWVALTAVLVMLPLDRWLFQQADQPLAATVAWTTLPPFAIHRLATTRTRARYVVAATFCVVLATLVLAAGPFGPLDPPGIAWATSSLLLVAGLFLFVLAAARRARSVTAVPPEHPIYADFGGPARPEPPKPLDPGRAKLEAIRKRRAGKGRKARRSREKEEDRD